MAFPPQFLDQLRDRIAVSEVIAPKVRLTRRGRESTGLCPFHNEKTPSFTANDDKGFYHCFGCGAHGDIISFVMETEGLSFPEAVEKLAGVAGLAVPQESPQERERAAERKTLQQVMETTCAWFENQLAQPGGREALDYLRRRGFTDSTIGEFRLGYAPDGRGRLGQALEARNVTREQLIEGGLVKRPEGGGEPRDYFFNRVVFPITDRRGQVIAFGGRILGEGQPKYLNSPETSLFHKGRVLYNWAMAREAARAADTIIVVEGYTDVIALAQAGLRHCVAPLGTALTEEQMLALWRMVDEPVLCFDGDNAGQRAAFRAAERALPLLQPGKSLRFVTLPAGEDPDSLVSARGRDGFQELLTKARPLVDVIWALETGSQKFATPEQRAALEKKLNEHVSKVADRGVQYHYQQRIREHLRTLFRRDQPARGGFRPGNNKDRRLPPANLGLRGDLGALRERQERVLLSIIINHSELVHSAAEQLSDITLTNTELDRILREILNVAVDKPDLDSRALQRHLQQCGYQKPLAAVLNANIYRQALFAAPEATAEDAARALTDIIAWHRGHRLKVDRATAKQDLADDMTSENTERHLEIVREQTGTGGL
ncbi:MAG: DNA primase [Alphaproteobacteria bacterium]|nr:DNA primase [Alphaproteobacteria bacterium]